MANIVVSAIGLWNELRQDLGAIGPGGETIHAPMMVVAGTVTAASPAACYSGVKAVTTAGTDVVLGTSQALKGGVQIKAHATNMGIIYVGPEGVAAATGYRLLAGESVFVAVDNVTDVWIDSSVNGEGVSWIGS